MLRAVDDPIERIKVWGRVLKENFIRLQPHPEQERKGESEDEGDEMHAKSARFYEAMSKLLESYLGTEVAFEKEIYAISESIEETDAQMRKVQEESKILQARLQVVKFTETTVPTKVMTMASDFTDNETSFKQVFTQLIEEKK